MKISQLLVIAALAAPVCRADDSLNLAEKFLDVSGTESFMQQSFESGLKPSLDQMRAKGAPGDLVESIHAEARNFFQENFKWEEMRPQLAKLYAEAFTQSELVAFYQTPTQNLLVAVFIANDSSNRILWSAMDLPTFYAGKGAAWSPATVLEGESARELFACGTIGITTAGEVPLVNVYFLANDDSGRLLTVGFIPSI